MTEARERAARAADRAHELDELNDRLATGSRMREDEVEDAREAAEVSAEDALAARGHDREERLRCAEAHRHAAAMYRQQGQLRKAEDHFAAAEADEKVAREP